MKSQKYRTTKNKFWGYYNKKMSWTYYKRGKKYQERILPSGFYEGQTYGALHKCWLGFVIAIEKCEWDKIEIYAKRIQDFEKDLGIEITNFSDWGI
ncbi:MAG TPA: hypothetical protein VFM31_09765 [Nitrososphaeraceae archaeon]|nr:hypothetical protein [Nitrososphaeraceae archaeon]